MRAFLANKLMVAASIALVLLVAAAAIFLVLRPAPYALHGGEYTPAQPAPPLDLADQNGQPFSLANERGKVSLVYFGYTTCPDLCPTTLSDYAVIKNDLGTDANRVNFVLVTFDPERDTPARLKEYLAFFDPDFIGLHGDAEQTAAAMKAYGVTANRVEYPESATKYLFDHSALVYLIDQEGNLRASYPYGTDPAKVAADLEHMLNG